MREVTQLFAIVRCGGFALQSLQFARFAFGTSAFSPNLTDWPGGGIFGVHGTNQPPLIPGRISHGCVRIRNEQILKLKRMMPLGTPIRIR